VLHLVDADPLDRFSIDQAVWTFGTSLETALEEATKNAKKESARKRARDKVFNQWLPGLQGPQKFRDPSAGGASGEFVRRV